MKSPRQLLPVTFTSVFMVATLTAACQPAPEAASEVDSTDVPPTATEVAQLIAPNYSRPERHIVTAKATSSDRIVWQRTYDGIPVEIQTKSVLEGSRWVTIFIPELEEPPLVDPRERISLEDAAAVVGAAEELRGGEASARYIYRPVFVSIPNKSEVKNAYDVDRFVGKYVLAVEIENTKQHTTTLIDAQSADVIATPSHVMSAFEVATEPVAVTVNYGPVELAAAGIRKNKVSVVDEKYKDLTRKAGSAPPRFQGVAAYSRTRQDWDPPQFLLVDRNSNFSNDYAFALQTSWDYFATAHGRLGITQDTTSSRAWQNNAVVFPITVADAMSRFNNSSGAFNDFTNNIYVVISNNPTTNLQNARLGVIGHEWAHGVFKTEAWPGVAPWMDGTNNAENGGLSESSADLFGELIEAFGRYRLGLQPSDEIQSTAWNTLRNMCSPSLEPNGEDTWSLAIENEHYPQMEPHRAAGPVNRVHCLIARGMVPFGTAPPSEPGLQAAIVPDGFAGLGSRVLAQIWYRTLSKLGSCEYPLTFRCAREEELEAAAEIYGVYSREYNAVEDAWAAVAVGFPADRTPPGVSLATTGIVQRGGTIEFNAIDLSGIAELTFSIDGGPITTRLTSPPWIYVPPSDLSEGWHVIHVTATDLRNVSKTYDFTIPFDFDPPSVVFEDKTPCLTSDWCPEYRMTRKMSVDATDFAGVRSIEIVANGAVVASAPVASRIFEYTFPAGGRYDLRVRATDILGHVNDVSAGFTTIDTTAPTLYVFSVTPSTATSGLVTWELCSKDGTGPNKGLLHSTLFIDGQPVYPGQDLFYFPWCIRLNQPRVPKGTHSFVLHVPDKWGNELIKEGTFVVTNGPPPPIDTTPPVVTVMVTGTASPYDVTATAMDASPLARAELLVDGVLKTTRTTQPFTFPYAPADAALHALTVRVTDAAGNTGSASIGAPHDLVPPTASLIAHQIGDAVTIDVNVSDPCGVQTPYGFYLDGTLFLALSATSSTVTLLPTIAYGPHVVSVAVSDRCGNSTQVSLAFDKRLAAPPVITNVTVNNSAPKQPKFTVTCTSTVGVHHVEAQRNGAIIASDATAPYELALDTTTWSDGDHVILFFCSDNDGLASAVVTRTVTADNTAPAFQFSVIAAGYQHLVSAGTVTDAHDVASVQLTGGLGAGGFSTTLTSAPWNILYTMPFSTQSQFPFGITVRDSWGNETSLAYLCNADTSITTSRVLACVPWQ